MMMKDLVAKKIFNQNGYIAPEESGAIKLDSNENPFSIQEPLKRILLEKFLGIDFNRYPAAGSPALRERFARYYGVKKNMIMPGNGSDELIQILCMTFKGSIQGVLVPVPTFSMYKIIAVNTGNKVVEVPLDKRFDLDVETMTSKIKNNFPALIFLSCPNSPTGNLFSRSKIEAIIKKTPGFVVIDEAYGAFCGQSLLPLLKKYDNVIFLKTLSKLGMASIRLGFLLGNADVIVQLDKVRLPYNVNALSQTAAGFFLDHQKEFMKQIKEITQRREELYRELKKIKWIKVYPSQANFIFFSCAFDSNRIYNKLVAEGIVVKDLNLPPLLTNCIRVTVGTKKENEAFLKTLKSITPERGA
ncbi:MAG TPA: histidinol-phosphate transaminase [Smithella sp.]|nr:histidinol-phosphate transaminase [Smithella sp.]HOU51629.1 histidinol-phosphate transaminase [Smithella sp.]HQG65720.1 histidinol-phosphate transaminase [Smithella sp.]HQI73467.1 histidinol-phosphate transaminase [Smithella sp.]